MSISDNVMVAIIVVALASCTASKQWAKTYEEKNQCAQERGSDDQ